MHMCLQNYNNNTQEWIVGMAKLIWFQLIIVPPIIEPQLVHGDETHDK